MNNQKLNNFNLNDRCPCGSGKLLSKCCLRYVFYKEPCNTKPKGEKTHLVTEGCYAASLRDCDGETTTAEHYVSQSLLRQIGKQFQINEYSSVENTQSILQIKEYAKYILCARHNTALNGLDTVAGRLFKTLKSIQKSKRPGWYLFAGEDFERWMLKLLIGYGVSGNPSLNFGDRNKVPPPEKWLGILFGYEEMPEGWGLYYLESPDEDRAEVFPLQVKLLYHSPNEVWGIRVTLLGLDFILCVAPLEWDGPEVPTFRPKRFCCDDRATIEFSWNLYAGKVFGIHQKD